ncbi:MAG: hypothetical protein GXP54_01975, partial [Deltaproteobacteria bacterium]|nr:hypothetical protein [Deltaproteobacteria bacterium]
MKVLFVTAPELNRRSMDSVLPPSGSMYLTGKLRGLGHQVDQIDLDAAFVLRGGLRSEFVEHPFIKDHQSMMRHLSGKARLPGLESLGDRLIEPVRNHGYDLIALSARRAPGTVLVAQALKRRFQVPIVVGGDTDLEPMEFMKLVPEADYCSWGMGEGPLPELLEAMEGRRALQTVRKLIANVDGRLIKRKGSETTMKDRVFADPMGLDVNPYLFQRHQFVMVPNPGARLLAPLQFIQGCPFHCSFCRVSADGIAHVHRKDPVQVAEEIHRLASLGVGDFAFLNNTLMAGRTYPRRIAAAITDTGVKVRWSDSASFNTLEEPDLDAMVASGCISL